MLMYLNLYDNTDDGGTPLSKKINKFEIDFKSLYIFWEYLKYITIKLYFIIFSAKEIFGFANQTLFKGNLGDPNLINFEELYTSTEIIKDLAVTPSHVYIVVKGNK